MKKLVSISLCFLFAFIAFSQSYSLRERYNLLSASHASMVICNQRIYTVGYTSDTSSPIDPMCLFSKHRLDGQLDTVTTFKIPGYMQTATGENSLILTKDSNLVCTGYCIDASNITKVLFLKYDINGNVLFYKTYSAVNSQRFFGKRIVETNDGFYIEGTIQYSNFDVNLFIIKIDATGNELWRKFYGSNSTDELTSAFIKTSNNRLLIAATKNNKDYSHDATFQSWCYLLMLDTAGNLIRDTIGIDPNIDVPQNLIETLDGKFIFCTGYATMKSNTVGTDFKGYVVKVDSNLNMLWEQLYADSSPVTTLFNVSELSTGELVAVGSNYNQLLHPYHNNGLIIKTDANGIQLWGREYRGVSRTGQNIEDNILYDCDILSDGNIIACGVAADYNDTFPQQAWLLRIDADGCMDNNFCGYTGIEQVENKNQEQGLVTVYPNPATNSVQVIIEHEMLNGEIKLYDVSGKIVLTKSVNTEKTMLNISELSKGLYIVSLEKDRVVARTKLIVD